jgi:hypothetical protein
MVYNEYKPNPNACYTLATGVTTLNILSIVHPNSLQWMP